MLNQIAGTLQILSHRACLYGPDPVRENTNAALRQAIDAGFDVEFDIRFDLSDLRLVLAHDPQPWSEDHDGVRFLQNVGGPQFHALNVKSLDCLPAILRCLDETKTRGNFMLFDFELVADDLAECRSLMRSVAEAGYSVAYRLSEREAYLEQYLHDLSVCNVWLDEFESRWVRQEHLERLKERAIRTFYVSPDLHGIRDLDMLKVRWEQLASWGVSGICTDFPVALREFLNKG